MRNLFRLSIAVLVVAPIVSFGQALTPSQDAYYVPGSATNFGSASTVTVGSSSSVGLVQFDLTALPVGTTASQVQSAKLTLFLDHVNSAGTINIDTVSPSTSWAELTVNGVTSVPSAGSTVATAVAVSTVYTFITVDATDRKSVV